MLGLIESGRAGPGARACSTTSPYLIQPPWGTFRTATGRAPLGRSQPPYFGAMVGLYARAAEATVGLALVIAIIRTRQTPEVDEYSDLKE